MSHALLLVLLAAHSAHAAVHVFNFTSGGARGRTRSSPDLRALRPSSTLRRLTRTLSGNATDTGSVPTWVVSSLAPLTIKAGPLPPNEGLNVSVYAEYFVSTSTVPQAVFNLDGLVLTVTTGSEFGSAARHCLIASQR